MITLVTVSLAFIAILLGVIALQLDESKNAFRAVLWGFTILSFLMYLNFNGQYNDTLDPVFNQLARAYLLYAIMGIISAVTVLFWPDVDIIMFEGEPIDLTIYTFVAALGILGLWFVAGVIGWTASMFSSASLASTSVWLITIIFAPVLEELFRATVNSVFKFLLGDEVHVLAIAIAINIAIYVFMFGFVHGQYWDTPGAYVGLAILTVVSTVLMWYTDDVRPSIVVHALWNALAITGLAVVVAV